MANRLKSEACSLQCSRYVINKEHGVNETSWVSFAHQNATRSDDVFNVVFLTNLV